MATKKGRRQFTAAFRDCTGKGMSFRDALASSISSTGDEGPLEGAREVFKSLFELKNKVSEGFGEEGGEGKKGGEMKTHDRVFHKDAARRFRAAFRDGVRENLPLPQIIEMGVISGTASNGKTPDSEGAEYKSPTKDAFRVAMRDALAKGIPTRDAIRAALTK